VRHGGRRLTLDRPVGRHDRDRGASAVELAIVAPALLILIFFSIQASLYYYGRVVAQGAAREGVSQLRLAQTKADADKNAAAIQTNVEDYAASVGRETLLAPVVDSGYLEEEGTVWVSVEGRVITLVPGLDLTVTQRVDGTVERFETDDRLRPPPS